MSALDTRAATTIEATDATGTGRRSRRRPRGPEEGLIPGARRGTYWLYLVPGLALLAVIVVVPLLWNVYLTFTEYRGIRPPQWIGLENWVELMGDEVFWTSFANSIAMIPSRGSVEKIASITSFAFALLMSVFLASFAAKSSFVI